MGFVIMTKDGQLVSLKNTQLHMDVSYMETKVGQTVQLKVTEGKGPEAALVGIWFNPQGVWDGEAGRPWKT